MKPEEEETQHYRNQTQDLRPEPLPPGRTMHVCEPKLRAASHSSEQLWFHCSIIRPPAGLIFLLSASCTANFSIFFPPRDSSWSHPLQVLFSEDKGNFFGKGWPREGSDWCCPASSHSLCSGGGDPWQEPAVSQANELSETHPRPSPPGQVIIMRAVSGG